MKLSTLALGAVALLAASNFAIALDTPPPADAATPAPAASEPAIRDADAPADKTMDKTPDKTTNKAANKEKTKGKTRTSASARPVSVQGRCAAKLGHAVGDNKWELKGDKADKAYFACVAKAEH